MDQKTLGKRKMIRVVIFLFIIIVALAATNAAAESAHAMDTPSYAPASENAVFNSGHICLALFDGNATKEYTITGTWASKPANAAEAISSSRKINFSMSDGTGSGRITASMTAGTSARTKKSVAGYDNDNYIYVVIPIKIKIPKGYCYKSREKHRPEIPSTGGSTYQLAIDLFSSYTEDGYEINFSGAGGTTVDAYLLLNISNLTLRTSTDAKTGNKWKIYGVGLTQKWRRTVLKVDYYGNGATLDGKTGAAPEYLDGSTELLKEAQYSYNSVYIRLDQAGGGTDSTWRLKKPGYHAAADWRCGGPGGNRIGTDQMFITASALADAAGENIDAFDRTIGLYADWTSNTDANISDISIGGVEFREIAARNGEFTFQTDLRSGQSFLIPGLEKGVRYQIDETGKTGYTPSFRVSEGAEADLKAVKRNGKTGESLGTMQEVLQKNMTYDYVNRHEPKYTELYVYKELKGEALDQSDYERSFLVRYSFSGLEKNTAYSMEIVARDADITEEDHSSFTADDSGNAAGTFSIRGGESMVIHKVPAGAAYEFSEVLREREDQQSIYRPSLIVSDGTEKIHVPKKYGEEALEDGGFGIETARETVNDAPRTLVHFINTRTEPRDIHLRKSIVVDGSTVEETNESFDISAVLSGLPQNAICRYERDGAVKQYAADACGEARIDFTDVTIHTRITLRGIPGSAAVRILERDPGDYSPMLTVTSENPETAENVIFAGENRAKDGLDQTVTGFAGEVTLNVINSRTTKNDLSINKRFDGVFAANAGPARFTVSLEGLRADTEYAKVSGLRGQTGTDGAEESFAVIKGRSCRYKLQSPCADETAEVSAGGEAVAAVQVINGMITLTAEQTTAIHAQSENGIASVTYNTLDGEKEEFVVPADRPAFAYELTRSCADEAVSVGVQGGPSLGTVPVTGGTITLSGDILEKIRSSAESEGGESEDGAEVYVLYHSESPVSSFRSDAEGRATVTFTLKPNEEITLRDLPNTAAYVITETVEDNNLAAKFTVEKGKQFAGAAEKAGEKGQALSTPKETLPVDRAYVFRNMKTPPEPVKTVSDEDNITLEGTGTEDHVTENTVPDRNSTWSYEILQEDIEAPISTFLFNDTLPACVAAEVIGGASGKDVDPMRIIWESSGTTYGGTVTKENVTETDEETGESRIVVRYFVYEGAKKVFEVFTPGDEAAGSFSVELLDEDLKAAGGTFKITMPAYIARGVSENDLKAAGLAAEYGFRFRNSAETVVNGYSIRTGPVDTNVGDPKGLSVKKFADEDGDETEAFDFMARFSGLTANREYHYSIPRAVRVRVSNDEEAVRIRTADSAGNEVKNVKMRVYDLNDRETSGGPALCGSLVSGKTDSIDLWEGSFRGYISYQDAEIAYDFDLSRDDDGSIHLVSESREEVRLLAAGSMTFAAEADGTAEVDFALRHGQVITFRGLDNESRYEITEAPSEKYAASYEVTDGTLSVKKTADRNRQANTTLSTGVNTFYAATPVTFAYHNRTLPAEVTFSKVSAYTKTLRPQTELPGAQLVLVKGAWEEREGFPETDVVSRWMSTCERKTLTLARGQEYTLIETAAPGRYELADNIRLRTTMEGTVEVRDKTSGDWMAYDSSADINRPDTVLVGNRIVQMTDEIQQVPVRLKKTDIDTGELLAGAVYELKNAAGIVVHRWTTEKGYHSVELSDGKYTAAEADPPQGYAKAEDIEFTVSGGIVTTDARVEGSPVLELNALNLREKHTLRNMILRKNVTGNLGDLTKAFEFTVELAGLAPNTKYPREPDSPEYADDPDLIPFISDGEGTAILRVSLKDDQQARFAELREDSTFRITEAASDHVASYRITADGTAPVYARRTDTNGTRSNRALATEVETLEHDDGDNIWVVFENNRDLAANTGIPDYLKYWIPGLSALAAGLAVHIRRMRRARRIAE